MEDGDKTWQEYHVCESREITNLAKFGGNITSTLSILSAIFLVLAFGLLYKEQREILFGSVKSYFHIKQVNQWFEFSDAWCYAL